jgi:hypothetical protein
MHRDETVCVYAHIYICTYFFKQFHAPYKYATIEIFVVVEEITLTQHK